MNEEKIILKKIQVNMIKFIMMKSGLVCEMKQTKLKKTIKNILNGILTVTL